MTPPPPLDPPPDDGGQATQAGRRLTRSTDDKVLTGLCGGLGRHFGLDPVIFRVAFVVLSIAGGTGVLLYLLGWLFVPDDQGHAATDRLTNKRSRQLVLGILIGAGILALFDGWDTGWGHDSPVALALIATGAVVLWSRRNKPGPGPDLAPAPAPGSPTAEVAPPPPPPPPSAKPANAAKAAKVKAPKPRSALVPVTLSALLMLGGTLALLDVTLATGLAIALLVTGAAMVVGAFRGRARWLIPVAMLLGFGLAVASVIDVPITGEIGTRRYQPAAIGDLRETYRLGIGEIIVDLRAIDLGGGDRSVLVTDGIGHLVVIVPNGPEVVAIGHAGAGDVRLFGRESDGSHVDRRVVSRGQEGGGRLTVRARLGAGQVEVRRAAA